MRSREKSCFGVYAPGGVEGPCALDTVCELGLKAQGGEPSGSPPSWSAAKRHIGELIDQRLSSVAGAEPATRKIASPGPLADAEVAIR